ncbi:MAG: serine/threonine-protein phosphatase [Myxococcales bacterium]|nr:serine/threonine-protein phosphatase [Myxococcales bacterium]
MTPSPDSRPRQPVVPALERDPFPARRGARRLTIAAQSDRGRQRSTNEDALLVAHLGSRDVSLAGCGRAWDAAPGECVLGVCDGMGGEAGGEVASRLAAVVVERVLSELSPSDADSAERALTLAVLEASRVVREVAREPTLARMGTTATIACVAGREVAVAQVGDSRAYLFRDGLLTRLTRDQSLAALMVEQGQVDEEEAEDMPGSHVILQAVGSSEALRVIVTRAELKDGDLLLLCSDGLTGPVRDRDIADVLARSRGAVDAACAALVELANARGGPDNVTCVIARVGPQ